MALIHARKNSCASETTDPRDQRPRGELALAYHLRLDLPDAFAHSDLPDAQRPMLVTWTVCGCSGGLCFSRCGSRGSWVFQRRWTQNQRSGCFRINASIAAVKRAVFSAKSALRFPLRRTGTSSPMRTRYRPGPSCRVTTGKTAAPDRMAMSAGAKAVEAGERRHPAQPLPELGRKLG